MKLRHTFFAAACLIAACSSYAAESPCDSITVDGEQGTLSELCPAVRAHQAALGLLPMPGEGRIAKVPKKLALLIDTELQVIRRVEDECRDELLDFISCEMSALIGDCTKASRGEPHLRGTLENRRRMAVHGRIMSMAGFEAADFSRVLHDSLQRAGGASSISVEAWLAASDAMSQEPAEDGYVYSPEVGLEFMPVPNGPAETFSTAESILWSDYGEPGERRAAELVQPYLPDAAQQEPFNAEQMRALELSLVAGGADAAVWVPRLKQELEKQDRMTSSYAILMSNTLMPYLGSIGDDLEATRVHMFVRHVSEVRLGRVEGVDRKAPLRYSEFRESLEGVDVSTKIPWIARPEDAGE